MDRQEFKNEVLQSDICPDDFEVIYGEFCQFQDDNLKVLNEFHRVCEKNGVHYQLAFGTLLGAIRDNGPIPWDYDIDVIVPYNEKEKLIKALVKDLGSDFYFKCFEVDSAWPSFIMRIAPKEYNIDDLHVDVFYIIGAPENTNDLVVFRKKVKMTFPMRFFKLTKVNDLCTAREKCKALLYKLLLLRYKTEDITKKIKVLCEKNDISKSKFCVSLSPGSYILDTEKLLETTLVETKVGTFRITKNFDYVLSTIYGDYRKIFPLENRLNEMITNYKHISGKNVKWKYSGPRGRYYKK